MRLSLEDARRVLLSAERTLASEEVDLPDAAGRPVQGTILARLSIPAEDHATVDGYAVRVADIAASPGKGLRLAGATVAGLSAPPPLLPGDCVAVTTGALIPPGTEAVVPLEGASRRAHAVMVASPPRAGSGIRRAGDDARAGDALIRSGMPAHPRTLERLAAQGIMQVPVARRARVHVIATGDELVPPGRTVGPGQRVASNLPMLEALVRACGGRVAGAVVLPDDRVRLREALAEAEGADLILTTGGTLRGPKDLTRGALAEIGAVWLFDGVRMRPGSSCAAATVRDRTVVCFPGSPGAAYLGFAALVRPLLRALHGWTAPVPVFTARLAEPLAPAAEETLLIAGVVQGTAAGLEFHRSGHGWPALGMLAPAPAGSEPTPHIPVELLPAE